MNSSPAHTSSTHRRRAVLAGAAVLGLGAVTTLAFWTDSEFLTARFGASGFQVQSATASEGPYSSHDSAGDAAELQFDFPTGELQVGQSTSAEFWLRMTSESAGAVHVLAPTVEREDLDGLVGVRVSQGSCEAPDEVLQEGLLEELEDAPAAFLIPAATELNPGLAQPVCITATLNDISGLPAGEHSTGRVAWEFLVTEAEA